MGTSTDKKWLLKAQGRILGPFCTNEIVSELKSGEFETSDEVAAPFKIWRPISDVAEFGLIVEELRVKKINEESSEDITENFQSEGSFTSSVTERVSSFNDDFTDEISNRAEVVEERPASRPQEIVYDEVVEESHFKNRKEPKAPHKVYGYQASQKAKQEAQGFSKFLWGIVFFIGIGVGLYFTYSKMVIAPKVKVTHLNEVKEKAKLHFEVGEYKEAFVEFQKAQELNPNDLEIHVFLGILFIGLEGQSFEGKRYLQHSLNKGGPNPNDTLTGLGMAFLLEEDFASAKNYFNKAQQINGVFTPGLMNLGTVEFYLGDLEKAEAYYNQAIQHGEQERVSYLLLAKIYIDKYFKTKDSSHLKKAKRQLLRLIFMDSNELQEALLFMAFLELLEGNEEEAEKRVAELLDVVPNLSDRFVRNLYIDRRQVGWGQLVTICERVVEKLSETPNKILLEALCFYKDDKLRLADRKITEAINQAPQNPLVQAHYAFVKNEMGENVEAGVAIGNAIKNNRSGQYVLPQLLQAEFCFENENFECAEDSWKSALKSGRLKVLSLSGLALTYNELGQMSKANNFIKKTFEYAGDYGRVLKLAREIDYQP